MCKKNIKDLNQHFTIVNKARIEKNKEIFFLSTPNYEACKNLTNYLPFIKRLVELTPKNNLIKDRGEFDYFMYYTFLFFLMNWDNSYTSSQITWPAWINFKNEMKNEIKNNKQITFDYSLGGLDYFVSYVRQKNKNKKIKIKKSLKYKILAKFQDNLILIYLNLRKLFFINPKTKIKNKRSILFMTNYERYFGNDRFFGDHLFEDFEFKNKIEELTNINLNNKKKIIFYFKPDFKKILKYGKHVKNRQKNHLFLEDLLSFKKNMSLLRIKKKIVKLNENLDFDQNFILEMYNDFLTKKFNYLHLIYLSIKEFIKKEEIEMIVGDSERNFIFFLMNIARKFCKNKIKTFAFCHEIISDEYVDIPYSENFINVPDYKLFWDEKRKKILMTKFNFPKKNSIIFPDPRFLYWKKKIQKNKTILFVSNNILIYNSLIDLLNNNKEIIRKLKSKGFSLLFKPHPGDFQSNQTRKKIEQIQETDAIKVITELNFLPEYAIGLNSTMLCEFLNAGCKTFFIKEKNFKNKLLIDETYLKKYLKNDILEVLTDIIKK